jgi:hypothetical protein
MSVCAVFNLAAPRARDKAILLNDTSITKLEGPLESPCRSTGSRLRRATREIRISSVSDVRIAIVEHAGTVECAVATSPTGDGRV